MSRRINNLVIGPKLAHWIVGEELPPEELQELERLCKVQQQAEQAKRVLIIKAMLRLATRGQTAAKQ